MLAQTPCTHRQLCKQHGDSEYISLFVLRTDGSITAVNLQVGTGHCLHLQWETTEEFSGRHEGFAQGLLALLGFVPWSAQRGGMVTLLQLSPPALSSQLQAQPCFQFLQCFRRHQAKNGSDQSRVTGCSSTEQLQERQCPLDLLRTNLHQAKHRTPNPTSFT